MTKLREGLVAMVVGAALAFPVLLLAELLPEPLTPGRTQALHANGTRSAASEPLRPRQPH